MPSVKVMTADCEEGARASLRALILKDSGCSLIRECSNAGETAAAVAELSPDILIVDACVAEPSRLDGIRAATERGPLVIVTSESGQYAAAAFEAHVFDYLLKPVVQTRFLCSLERAKTELELLRRPAAEVVSQPSTQAAVANRIAVKKKDRVVFITPDQIDWISAADNYVSIHVGSEAFMLRKTLNETEKSLDPASFARVHRSAIVNIDRIAELQPWFRGDCRIVLRNGKVLTMTRKYRTQLESRLLLGAISR